MAADDEEVEAWYLEGWCFFLMAEQAHETSGTFDEVPWEDLARDARDCLETCQMVLAFLLTAMYFTNLRLSRQLHLNQNHPDIPLLEHVKELIGKLDILGVKSSPDDDYTAQDEGVWEDVDGNEDSDVDMS